MSLTLPSERLSSSGGAAALADAFVTQGADTASALCALNDHLLMANPRATRCLLAADQQALWQAVRSRVVDATPFQMQLTVNEKLLWLHCTPVFDGDSLAGVLVDFDPTGAVRADAADTLASSVPGGSVQAQEARAQIRREIGSLGGTLITGEQGAGKAFVARALLTLGFPDREFAVFDAAHQQLGELRHHASKDAALILLHIDHLSPDEDRDAATLLAASAFDRPVIATAEVGANESLLTRMLLGRVHVPALSDRMEDLPLIAAGVLATVPGRSYRLAGDARRLLLSHDWDGNVGELRAVLLAAVSASPSRVIQAHWIQLPRRVEQSKPRAGSLRGEERIAIMMALERSGGNKLIAADLLGIARSTLYKKMTALQL